MLNVEVRLGYGVSLYLLNIVGSVVKIKLGRFVAEMEYTKEYEFLLKR